MPKRKKLRWKDYREMLMKMRSQKQVFDRQRFMEGVRALREMFGDVLDEEDAKIALGVATYYALISLKPENIKKEDAKTIIKKVAMRMLSVAFNMSEEEILSILPKERKYNKLVVEIRDGMTYFFFIKKEGLEGKLDNVDAELLQLL